MRHLTAALAFIAMHSGGWLSPQNAGADVKLPAIISDHMVLQQDAEVAVWGWADRGEKVRATIAEQTQETTASASGKWIVRFNELPTGAPLTLTVEGNNTLTVKDVLVGEVWLAAGQSNMQMVVRGSNNGREEASAAELPEIRMFTVTRATATTPQEDCGGSWIVCSPQTVLQFSATAYFFGRDLHHSLGAPIGLINASWGGTPIEAWTSMDAQRRVADLQPLLAEWRRKGGVAFDAPQANARYEKQLAAWKVRVGKAEAAGDRRPQPPRKPVDPRLLPGHPANLFNGMIAPVIPYAIRGAIWYQGEANAQGSGPTIYAQQLAVMIEDWRQRWGQGDFPFAWVQLPNFKKRASDPGAPSAWALMRENYLNSLAIPNTGMAITIDVGDATNIHPKDKQSVGKRLALWARARVYGEQVSYSGPLPVDQAIRGSEIVVTLAHADGGLKAKGEKLVGFAIAGADREWFWADARIEGDKVVVSSPQVPTPEVVRYAWGDNPECNLYNSAGLPATPFRTDK